MSNYIKLITCRSASGFLDSLAPQKGIWRGDKKNRWIFRGQSDDQYKLVPKSLRNGQRLSFKESSLRAPLPKKEQINAEINLIFDFATYSDDVGLTVPGYIDELRHVYAFDQFRLDLSGMWPHPKLLDLLALAQHHGVPTRLIDFTYNPFIAAYFAARQQLADEEDNIEGPGTKIAVWGIDRAFIHKAWHPYIYGQDIGKGKLRTVNVQRAMNLFLFRQQALFLYDQNELASSTIYRRHYTIDEVIVNACSEMDMQDSENSDIQPPIIKVMVKKECAREILRHLKRYNMTKSYLMPTYDNVVQELWQSRDE